MKKGKTIDTLSGIIIASDWDENNRVTAVKLAANDEEDYLIENGDKFIDLVHVPVEVTGIINRKRRDSKRILIKKFHILETNYF